MMAEESDDLPEEISDAMQAAGFAPTLPNLRELIANCQRFQRGNLVAENRQMVSQRGR
jgi:hypothetical protein